MAARSFLPTISTGCLASASRKARNSLRPEFWSARKRLAKLPSWISVRIRLHRLAAFVVDDARAGDVVAPLRGVGDGVAHVSQAAAIDEVDDELELVEHFEVGALGLIAGLDEGFVAGLDERADAAAEHGLLAEEIGLGLFLERGLEHPGAGAADALEVAEGEGVGVAGCVLVDGDEAGNAAAFGEDFAHAMAGSLGSGHAHVDAGGGNDGLEVNVEAMREEQHLAGVRGSARSLRRTTWPAV